MHDDGSITVDARYTVRSEAGYLLYIQSHGYGTGPPEVLERLVSGTEPVDPTE